MVVLQVDLDILVLQVNSDIKSYNSIASRLRNINSYSSIASRPRYINSYSSIASRLRS